MTPDHLLDTSQGWMRTPRTLFDPQHPLHPRSSGAPACPAFAFLDLVAQARWRDGNGLRRGELRAAERFLADRWQWSRSRVHRFLEDLTAEGAIRRYPPDGRRPGRIEIPGYNDFMPGPAKRGRNRKLNRKLNRKNLSTKGGSPYSRTANRTTSGTAGETEEEGRRTDADQGEQDYARGNGGPPAELCSSCHVVEIDPGRDWCSRCERLDQELAEAFGDDDAEPGGELPELPF